MKNSILLKYRKNITIESLIFVFMILFCIIFTIFFSSINTWLICISSILGIIASKKASEGKWSTFVFDILSYIVYIYSCIKYQYYGEMILSYIVIFCHLYGIIQWKKYQNNNIVKVNKIDKTHFFMFVIIGFICFNVYYFILKTFNTSLAFVNAIASVLFLMGNYLSYKRSVLQFVFWSLYEICFIFMWLFTIDSFSPGGIIFLIDGVCELVYNIIGIQKWNKFKYTQNTCTILARKIVAKN